MFSFSPGQGLVEHILVIFHGIMWKERRSDIDQKMGKVAKGDKQKKRKKKKKRKKERNNCSFMFLRFYVERAWNQKKLSIGD